MSIPLISDNSEEPLNQIFLNLCKNFHSFLDKKIIKKYIFPNETQSQKDSYKSNEIQIDNKKIIWTYYNKEKELTKEEIINDVFKDDKFLALLQNLTNELIAVIQYLEENINNIKRLEEAAKDKEQKINTLTELKDMLNFYFNETKDGQINANNILEDKNLLNIINKIQSFKSNQNEVNSKINQNCQVTNDQGNNNIFNDNNSNNNKNNCELNEDYFNNNLNESIHKIKEEVNIKNENIFLNNNSQECSSTKINIFNQSPSPTFALNEMINNNQLIDNEIISKETKDNEDENFHNISLMNNSFQKENNSENKNEENYELYNQKKEKIDQEKDKVLLNKKTERQNGIIKQEKININNIKRQYQTPTKPRKKNKKKKASNDNDKEQSDNIENSQPNPVKEEIVNLPSLTLRAETDKKNIKNKPEKKESETKKGNDNKMEIDDEIIKLLLEEDNIKKDDKKINSFQNKSLENEFESMLKKEFYKLNTKNVRVKTIKDLLSLIKFNNVQNYNPKINGPYLVGSYRSISDLPLINYFTSIDIMFTYRDISIDKEIINYTINNMLKKLLNLNKIKISEPYEFSNKIKKIKISCSSIANINLLLSFDIFFVDIGVEDNEKIINDILFNREKINFENKEEEKRFINIMLYLRIWRKKNKLYFLIPEVLDEIAKKEFEKKRSMGVVIFNTFFDLYNEIIDFYSKYSQGVDPEHKSIMEKIIKSWYNNEINKKMLQSAILNTNVLITQKNFKALFNNEEEN